MTSRTTYRPLIKHIGKLLLLAILCLCFNDTQAQTDNQPITLTPFNHQVITSEAELRSTIFSWSGTNTDFGYQIAFYPVYPCQDPLTAFRVNHPIYIKYCFDEYFYLLEDMNFNDGTYVWSVTTESSGFDQVWSPPSIFVLSTGNGSELFYDTGMPCDTPGGCMQIQVDLDKEFPISVGVSISDQKKFKYPRALPIRAEGLDYDKVTFRCKGCSAEDGTETRYYQDRVSTFDWVLEGKGSLGDPFKAKKVDSLNNELDALNKKIAELQDKISKKQGLVDSGIDQQIEKNKNRIDDLEKQKSTLDSLVHTLDDTRDSLQDIQDETIRELTKYRSELEIKIDSLKLIQQRIDTLNGLLGDKFTPDELAMLSSVEALLDQKASVEQQIETENQTFEQELQQINNEINQLEADVASKNSSYLTLTQQVEVSTKKIAALNAQLYANQALFNYYQARNRWTLMVKTFDDTYDVKDFDDLFLATFNASESLSRSSSNRTSNLAVYLSKLEELRKAMDKAQTRDGSANAREAYNLCLAAIASYRNSVETLSKTSVTIDTGIAQKIETEQDKLATYESQIVSTTTALENAINQFNEKLKAYDQRIIAHESTLAQLAQQLNDVSDQLAEAQDAFNKKVEERRAETEKNKDAYVTEINEKELIKVDINIALKEIYEKIIKAQADSSIITKEIKFVDADKRDLERQKAEIDQEIERLRQENKDLEDKKSDLKREINAHKKELDDLKKKKEELLGNLEVAKNASKTAKGAYVYYIPPTIDELLKGTAAEKEFKRLVVKVEERKDSLKQALSDKEALQEKLSKATTDVAKELLTLKDIEEQKKKLEEDQKKATDKIADQKFEAGKKIKEAREEEEAKRKELEEKKNKLAEDVKNLEKEKEDTKKELDDQRELVRKNDSLLTDIRKLIEQKLEERSNEEFQETQRKSNISDNAAKLRAEKQKETQIKNEIGRANNDLSRASAADNIAGIAQYRKELNNLQKQLDENKTQINFYVTELGIMAGKLKEIKDKIAAINKEIEEQTQRYNSINLNQRAQRNILDGLENSYDEFDAKLLQAQKDEKNLESLQAKNEEEVANVDSLLDKDEDLKKAKKEAEEIDGKLKKLDKDKDKAQANIETIIEEKEKEEKRVKKQLEDAQDKFKTAQDSLKDFIEKEFDKASFTTKIKLMAKDDVIDQWRSEDQVKKENITLIYKDRLPTLIGPTASGSGAKDVDPSKCYPIIENDKLDPPGIAGITAGKEPRTIAMIYDEGRLLYEKWPVIPEDAPRLAKDVVVASVITKDDKDDMNYQCISDGESPEEKAIRIGEDVQPTEGGSDRPTTGGDNSGGDTGGTRTRERDSNGDGTRTRDGEGSETDGGPTESEEDENDDFCVSVAGLYDTIVDIGRYIFDAKTVIGPNTSNTLNQFLWEPLDVDKTKKQETQTLKANYDASVIYPDDIVKGKGEHLVQAGVMIETTDSIKGSPEGKEEITTRIVRGDHTGLPGEEIALQVRKTYGDAEGFGFSEGGSQSATKTTKSSGYMEETFFYFGKGYGRFEITVQWKRGGKVIEEDKIDAESPLLHHYRSLAYQVNKKSLDKAMEMVKSNSSNTTAALADLDTKDKGNWLIFGTQNYDKSFANKIELTFKSEGKAKVDPEKGTTKDFGIAMTMLKDVPENEKFSITSKAPDKYKEITHEFEASGNVDTEKINQFKIGSPANPFIVELKEEVSPGETIKGTGFLSIDGVDSDNEVIKALKKIELKIEDVEVEKRGEDIIATAGKVTYESADGIKFQVLSSFDFTIASFGVTAGSGGTLAGKVKHEKLEEAVEFEAEIDPAGNFLGKLSNLPEIEVREFKLKKGSSIVLDMHSDRSKDVIPYRGAFYGIVIQKAELELPKSFNREGVEEPTTISVEDFYISKEGFGGSIQTKGQLLAMGFSGYELRVSEVSMKFERSALKEGSINGEMALPSPMEGNVGIGLTISKDKIASKLSTDKPVQLPQFKTTFVLKKASVEYDFEKEIGTLELSALINSTKFGDIKIEGFVLKSNGEVEAESISVEEDITIGGGFTMNLRTLGFKFKDRNDYAMNFDGKVDFKGILAIDAKADIKPGPTLTFEKLNIDFDKGPVNFKGEFTYSNSVFEGGFDVKFKKFNKGLEGYVIVGNQKVSEDESFGYWYGEISTSVAIPIAQTGFSFLKFGGGVGYNFVPPIGDQKGSPLKDGGFAIKALVGIGNTPTGEVIAGEMEMTYVSGNFSLFGKAWLLTKEESLYGQGQINLRYNNSSPEVDGYLAAFIGLTDAEGKVFLGRGRVNFSYPPKNGNYVWTENVRASIVEVVNAEASLVISETMIDMKGRLYYDVSKDVPLGFGTLKASFDLDARLQLQYQYKTVTGFARPALAGNWDVNIEAFDKSFDILSGHVAIRNAELRISPSQVSITGTASASYQVLWFEGSTSIDVDYSTSI